MKKRLGENQGEVCGVGYLYRAGFAGCVVLSFQSGNRAATCAPDVRDFQRASAGVGEFEIAGVPRPQCDPAQIAYRVFKRNLRRNVLLLSPCRSENYANQGNSDE